MRRRPSGLFAATLLFLTLAVAPALAQEFRVGEIDAQGTAYYRFARPGEATVQVLVIGSGGGIYEVGAMTRLDEFLALLGGAPQFATRSSGSRTRINVKLYRFEDGRRTLLYDERLEDMILAPGTYPNLGENDIFVVETITRPRIGWREGLQILTSVSSLILVMDRLGVINLRGRN